VFLLVILLKSGLSVPETIMALAATVLIRLVARRAVTPFAARFGLKATLILGCLVMALQYPLTAAVDGVGVWLLLRCLASGVGEAFYWTSFHAYFASVGDSEHRGHQIGAREALAAGIGVVAPLFGAWALMNLGAGPAFAAIGGIQALGVVPLLWAPSVAVVRDAPGMREAARLGSLVYLANGWFAATFVLVWQVALFLSLSESLSAYGGTMAIAAIAGGIGGLLLGRILDGGHGATATLVIFAVSFDGMPDFKGSLLALLNPENLQFIVAWLLVGGFFAGLIFAVSVVSIPMILDRDTDAISAAITSIQVVYENTGVMILWGLMLTTLVVAALIPWGLGLLLVGPLLGHSSWHAYRGSIEWLDDPAPA
jgi:MFS family permease